jgi:hypothetical protein
MFYRQCILVIDGKYNNNNGMSTGKYNNKDGMSTGKNNNNDSFLTGRVCFSLMTRLECASMAKHEQRKLRRISAESYVVHRCASGMRLTHCQSSREIAYSGSQVDQRSRSLTLRNSSKSGGCISSGREATVIVGSHSEFSMTVRSESRQEERKDGGQISGVRSERGVRPSLDLGEPAHSLKC